MTHTGTVQRLDKTETVRLMLKGKSWVDQRGIRYSRETGRRPMDSGNGVVLLLNTIKPLDA